jgi:hypothetical protein
MNWVLALVVLVGGTYLVATEMGVTSSAPLFTGETVEVDTEAFHVSFSRRGSISGWFLVSGGDSERLENNPLR